MKEVAFYMTYIILISYMHLAYKENNKHTFKLWSIVKKRIKQKDGWKRLKRVFWSLGDSRESLWVVYFEVILQWQKKTRHVKSHARNREDAGSNPEMVQDLALDVFEADTLWKNGECRKMQLHRKQSNIQSWVGAG